MAAPATSIDHHDAGLTPGGARRGAAGNPMTPAMTEKLPTEDTLALGASLGPAIRHSCRDCLGEIEWFRSTWQRGGAATGNATWTTAGRSIPVMVKAPVGPVEFAWTTRLGACDPAQWDDPAAPPTPRAAPGSRRPLQPASRRRQRGSALPRSAIRQARLVHRSRDSVNPRGRCGPICGAAAPQNTSSIPRRVDTTAGPTSTAIP